MGLNDKQFLFLNLIVMNFSSVSCHCPPKHDIDLIGNLLAHMLSTQNGKEWQPGHAMQDSLKVMALEFIHILAALWKFRLHLSTIYHVAVLLICNS